MGTVYDIAARLIDEQHRAGRTIDKMQLQKLLYLVQGTHVALHGHTAFRDDFRAYKRGPVIEAVEDTYRTVTSGMAPLPHWVGGDPGHVTDEQLDAIREVLRQFGTYNGPSLENITKRPGAPWQVARGDTPKEAEGRKVIPATLIAEWFLTEPALPSQGRTEVETVDSFEDVEAFLEALG